MRIHELDIDGSSGSDERASNNKSSMKIVLITSDVSFSHDS